MLILLADLMYVVDSALYGFQMEKLMRYQTIKLDAASLIGGCLTPKIKGKLQI